MKKILSFLGLCFLLAACAGPPPMTPEAMSPPSGIYSQLPSNPDFVQNIKLGRVHVAKEATTHQVPVTVPNYTQALQNALLGAGFATRIHGSPKYILDASLLHLDETGYFTRDATAKARYTLKRADTKSIVLEETVILSAHVPYSLFADSIVMTKTALTQAMQENITHFIRVLASKAIPPLTSTQEISHEK